MFRNPALQRAIQQQERTIRRGGRPAIIVLRVADPPDRAKQPWTWPWAWMWLQRINAIGSLFTLAIVIAGFIVVGFQLK